MPKRLPDATRLRIENITAKNPSGEIDIDETMKNLQVFVEDLRGFLLDLVQIQEYINKNVEGQQVLRGYQLTDLPPALEEKEGGSIYVQNATGGSVPCYTRGDGIWRRYSDDTQVS